MANLTVLVMLGFVASLYDLLRFKTNVFNRYLITDSTKRTLKNKKRIVKILLYIVVLALLAVSLEYFQIV